MTSRKYRQTTLSFPTKPANIHSDCSTPSIDTGQPVVFPGSHNDIFWVNKALPELDQNDCNSYIKFNLSRVAVPEGVPTDLRNLNEVDILVRVVLVELIHSIKSKTRFRTILRGPGGAGKSTSLLLLQKAAKELGMVVAYIPQGNSFGSNVTAAQINSFCLTWLKAFVSGNRQILEKISCIGLDNSLSLLEFSSKDIALSDAPRHFVDVLTQLQMCESEKVLIVVDQWNAVHTADNLLANYFKNFSTFNVQNGSFVVAISSSFDPNPRLQDGDATLPETFTDLLPYSEQEFAICYKYFKNKRVLNDNDTLEKVAWLTGRIPRHLTSFAKKKDFNTWDRSIIEYYKIRIQKIIDMTNDVEGAVFLAEFLRYGSGLTELPNFWSSIGLVSRKTVTDPYEHVCPAVGVAALEVMAMDISKLLKVMRDLGGKSLEGQLFEIWVCMVLRSGKARFPTNHNLKGSFDGEPIYVSVGTPSKVTFQNPG